MPDSEITPEAMKAAARALASMGGTARAKKLSKRRRIEIAKLAINARWDAVRRKAKRFPSSRKPRESKRRQAKR